MLIHGQHKIGSQLDCLQREQVKSKQELEGDLMNIMDELKGDIAGKSLEQSVELEKVKVKVSVLLRNLCIRDLTYVFMNVVRADNCRNKFMLYLICANKQCC